MSLGIFTLGLLNPWSNTIVSILLNKLQVPKGYRRHHVRGLLNIQL